MDEDYFSGPERIGVFEPSGRPMRFGDPDELAVSSYDRTRQALAAGDVDKAADYVALQFEGGATMMAIYGQWPSAYLLAALEHLSDTAVQTLVSAAFEHWRGAVASLAAEGDMAREVVARATSLLDPDRLTVDLARQVIDAFRLGQSPGYLAAATAMIDEWQTHLMAALSRGDAQAALQAHDQYFTCARAWHDALMQYTDSFPTAAAGTFGQGLAETLVAQSFDQAPFGAGLWAFGETLSPKQLAAFLLAHLRDHYSGPSRRGSVFLREDEECYRLIFDPCGSGGAMRRRLGPAQLRLPDASAATFGRSGEVPPYCTHCAFNARTAIARFGWPIYTTEFDPDPTRPCGWTIYKDADHIPERYFENVGYRKEPKQFRLEYWKRASG